MDDERYEDLMFLAGKTGDWKLYVEAARTALESGLEHQCQTAAMRSYETRVLRHYGTMGPIRKDDKDVSHPLRHALYGARLEAINYEADLLNISSEFGLGESERRWAHSWAIDRFLEDEKQCSQFVKEHGSGQLNIA